MYTLNGWWFLSSGGSYPPVFMVATAWSTRDTCTVCGHPPTMTNYFSTTLVYVHYLSMCTVCGHSMSNYFTM